MKKVVFKIMQYVMLYIFCAVYGYYNLPAPENCYSWLISAILLIIIVAILKIVGYKNNK